MYHILGEKDEQKFFLPHNGNTMSSMAEGIFDKDANGIGPKAFIIPIELEFEEWQKSEPRYFNIRIVDLEDLRVQQKYWSRDSRLWWELGGKEVQLRTAYRPTGLLFIDIVATPISGNHGTKADQTNNALSKATLGKSWSVLRESTLNGFGGEDGPTMVIICCRVQPLKKMSRRKRKWTL